jgi:hypothetical protein
MEDYLFDKREMNDARVCCVLGCGRAHRKVPLVVAVIVRHSSMGYLFRDERKSPLHFSKTTTSILLKGMLSLLCLFIIL